MIDLIGSIADAMVAQNAFGAIKTEVDLERYKLILDATKPSVIIECGTCNGKSALWFADNSDAKVITIDIDPKVQLETCTMWKHRVYPLAGSSVDPVIVGEVLAQVNADDRVMVILDSDHSAAHVSSELEVYAPLVTAGCYLVVEDTMVRWMPWTAYEGSPLDAVEAFLKENGKEWLVDMEIEDLHARTQHPNGWLRRMPYVLCGNGNSLSEETWWPCIRELGHDGDCDHSPRTAEMRSILAAVAS